MRAKSPELKGSASLDRIAAELVDGNIIDFASTKGMVEMKIYRGKDLRKGRYSELNRPYLLTTVTHQRQEIFRDLYLGRLLVRELREVTDRELVETFAWVIMPDHLHWLVVPRSASLEMIVNRVKSKSAIAINRKQATNGPVWQRGYHDHAIRFEEGIRDAARYIVANPLRAGIVKRLGDYSLWDAVWL